jgi:hypothetical protein
VTSLNAPGLPTVESMTGGGIYPVGLCVSSTGGGRATSGEVIGWASGDGPTDSCELLLWPFGGGIRLLWDLE